MEAGALAGWNDFLVAEVGSAAALAGLLFVAVSINLTRILEFPQLPTRAGEALVTLLSVLFIASLALVPRQTTFAYGLEFACIGLVTWIIQTTALMRTHGVSHQYKGYAMRIAANQLPPLPFIVAGVLLMAGHDQGAYWIAPGILLSFAAGVFDTWVLLIEIQR